MMYSSMPVSIHERIVWESNCAILIWSVTTKMYIIP